MSTVGLLRKLVEFPSYQPEGMHRCAEFLSNELSRLGFTVAIDKLGNVYGSREFAHGDGAYLVEVDLGTVTPTANWTKKPLSLTVEGDRLYGLNVSDKAGVAAVLQALEDLGQSRFRKLEILFASPSRTAEEIGIEYFLKRNKLDARIGINLTGTVQGERFMMSLGCGGVVRFTVTTIGKQATTTEPTWRTLGHNAIYDMMKVIEALRRLPSAKMKIDDYQAWSEVNVKKIEGGTDSSSIIPSECNITCSRLVLPNEDLNEVKKQIDHALHALRGVELKVTYSQPEKPYLIDRAHPAVTLAVEAVRNALGYTPKFRVESGITDCPILDEIGGVKTIAMGPSDPLLEHKSDEYVSAKRIEEFTKILRSMLTNTIR